MKLSRYARRKIGLLLVPSVAGLCIGAAFSVLISQHPTARTVIQGMICGFLIGFTAVYLEYFVFDRIRKLTIYMIILTRSVIFCLVTVAAYIISDVIVFGFDELLGDLRNYMPATIVVSVISILAVVLFINLARLLGQKGFFRLMVGLYHKPVLDRRIFMFIDLAGSTSIAEEIGDIGFHSFLNDFFFDATRPIVECKGEIYKYVGDEIIVTWAMKSGLKDGNALECYFMIEEKIDGLRDAYQAKYGFHPRFTAGIHCGTSVIGEMGDYKREVAFLGDVVNTTSRIQAECKARSRKLIISGTLKKEFNETDLSRYTFESLGSIALRGKKQEIELFSVSR
ncbi:MAG: adenylate/guanylate cyclase domain-containing protein [Spirochaetes bacterium]|nr:adenylate/guanylate cyclase domain-containing protein [Spirochaetota bacterium]